MIPVYEDTQAATTINKYVAKGKGTGGRPTTDLQKKPIFVPPPPIAKAY